MAEKKKSIVFPLILSAFVFPGTGHFLLGRKKTAIGIIVAFLISLIFLIVNTGQKVNTVMQNTLAKNPNQDITSLTLAVQKQAESGMDLSSVGIFGVISLLIWLGALIDIVRIGMQKDEGGE